MGILEAHFQEISVGTILAKGLETTHILQRVWVLFALCPKNLPEAKCKSFELIAQFNFKAGQYGLSRLVFSDCSYLNEKEETKEKEIQNVVYCLKRKRVLKNVMLVSIPVLKEMRNLNKGIMLNGIWRAVSSGEVPLQPHCQYCSI